MGTDNRNSLFRLLELTLDGIKNVEHGSLIYKKSDQISRHKAAGENAFPQGEILGVYGPNGSGKTATVEALRYLTALAWHEEEKVDHVIERFLCVNCEQPSITYRFYVRDQGDFAGVFTYKVSFKKNSNKPSDYSLFRDELRWKLQTYSHDFDSLKSGNLFIDYLDNSASFSTMTSMRGQKQLGKTNSDKVSKLASFLRIKNMGVESGIAMLMSDSFIQFLKDIDSPIANLSSRFLEILKHYIQVYIKLYTTESDAFSILGASSFSGIVHSAVDSKEHSVSLHYRTDKPFIIRSSDLPYYRSLMDQINAIVGALLPGFKAELRVLETNSSEGFLEGDGTAGNLSTIEIVRIVGNYQIPMSNESAGIKKFVSLAGSLIALYKDPSFILVVDEMDSGVYEYLLGQILETIAGEPGAKGQLFFTCHNLRPLEVLHGQGIYVTTLDPMNKFTLLKGLKANNNARTSYFRALQFGGQDYELYKETFTSEIARALRKGGNISQ